MALNTQIEKTRKELEKTLTEIEKSLSDPTPLYAVVGAGDLAVEKLRGVSAELSARAARFDPKVLRSQAQSVVDGATARVESVQSEVKAAPEQVKDLPTKAQAVVGDCVATAFSAYGDLAGRGKNLVTRVRNQQATIDLENQAKTTVSRAKATATSTRKAAETTASSAKATTTTAKKSATTPKRSAKATTTSAKKTAGAAKQATTKAAEKTGD